MLTGVALVLSLPLGGYMLWHSVNIFLSAIACHRPRPSMTHGTVPGKVALLYLTCDDIDPLACSTLLGQEEIDFDIFILDDSTRGTEQRRIDAWCRAQARPITIVRRMNKEGFKSGNINHWLTYFGDSDAYPYILVVDADEQVAPDFTSRLLCRLLASRGAFAQACHLGTAKLSTHFQRILHPQVMSEWVYQVPARNVVGFPPMLGHGVLLRTECVRRVGGFPALVSEDLALTLRLAESGQTGIVAVDVFGYEAFPPSYLAYWKRRRRWIQADAELVRKMLISWWHSSVGWWGKVDLSLRELRLPLTSLYWPLLMYVASTAALGGWQKPSIVLPTSIWIFFPVVVAPVVSVLTSTRMGFGQKIRYLCAMPFVGAATVPLHPVATVQGMAGIRAFESTGSSHDHTKTHRWCVWEVFTTCLLCLGGALSVNLVLVAVGLSCGCSPLLRSRWQDPTLMIGSLVFWALLACQIGMDIISGVVPVDHVLVLTGLTMTLV